MKTTPILRALALVLTLTSTALHAQVPQILNYQGRVAVGSPAVNFDGSGQFKFALVQGEGPTLLWKNDGSAGNTEPATAVTLPVTKGLYSVLLGANMTPIPATVFVNPDVRLRVWFNDGVNGSQLLTPDQRIAAVGYAMVADQANGVADGAITSSMLAAGSVSSDKIAAGAVTGTRLATGAAAENLSADGTLELTSDGLVGIGTGSPEAGLHVANGTLGQITEIKDGVDGFNRLSQPQGIALDGSIAYVTSYAEDTLSIIDLSNPATPRLLAEVRDGVGGFNLLNGPLDLVVSEGLAYVVSELDNSLTIINVSDPANPTLVAEVQDGVTTGFDELGGARALAKSGDYLYISASADNAVSIVNVQTPAAPTVAAVMKDEVGGFTDLQRPWGIAVEGEYAYITAYDDDALNIVDISTPEAPVLKRVAKLNVGGFTHLDAPRWVDVSGTTAYVVALASNAFTTIDVSDPENRNPTQLAVRVNGGGYSLNGPVMVKVSGTTAYVAAATSDALTRFDISDPANPVVLDRFINGQGGITGLDNPRAIAVSGSLVCVTAVTSHTVAIFRFNGLVVDNWVGIGTSTPQSALDVAGTATATAFSGDGSGLTGLDGANITSGSVTSSQLGSDLTLNGTTTGTFSGDGAGMTNIPAANITGTISSTQLASNLSLPGTTTGTFSGDGAGLTNISAANIAGSITSSQLYPAIWQDIAFASQTPAGMAFIPTGPFTMGSTSGDIDSDAFPTVTTVSAFYMDVNEVTKAQWDAVRSWGLANGYTDLPAGSGKAANHPVQTVNWYDVVKWCNARSEQAGRTPVYYTDDAQTTVYNTGNVNVTNAQVNWSANGYRLPTEAEWEKAARGGVSGKRFPWGDAISQNRANYNGDTGGLSYDLGPDGYNAIGSVGGTSPATSPVGSFAANGYGLNDMAGNVFEWCWDWYYFSYDGGSDPHGPNGLLGSFRVRRGGSWSFSANSARCAKRFFNGPVLANDGIGFRAVLAPGQ